MPHPVTLIPGDGIGPEVADAVVRIIDSTGVPIRWDRIELNKELILAAGGKIPPAVLDSLHHTLVGLKGPVTTPVGSGFRSLNVQIRKALNLYANVRPVHNLAGLQNRYQDTPIDLIIFRENTEDLYSGLENEVTEGVITSIKVITEKASTRIARYAFQYARKLGRKHVTSIHKANIMKLGDGLFIECCRRVAQEYDEIAYSELIVDNAAMQLVMRPEQFDILLMPNLYGDIISDLAAGLVGGLGIVPGANMGDDHAVFEAVHGSAPDIAGKGIANPTALLQSAVLMLLHLGEEAAATRVHKAIESVYEEGKWLTRDLGGRATTDEFTAAVIDRLGV